MPISVTLLHYAAQLPTFAHQNDAGADVICIEDLIISPGETVLARTGLSLEIPPGFEVQVRSKSGLAMKGIIVLNSPGTIDAGYTGEVKVLLLNVSQCDVKLYAGFKIAQLVFARLEPALYVLNRKPPSKSSRGDSGFGSTGDRVYDPADDSPF